MMIFFNNANLINANAWLVRGLMELDCFESRC